MVHFGTIVYIVAKNIVRIAAVSVAQKVAIKTVKKCSSTKEKAKKRAADLRNAFNIMDIAAARF